MNSKDYQSQTRRFFHSATRCVYLFAAMLILCYLAAFEALGQKNCLETFKNCSACQQETFQGRNLTGVSTDSNGNCVATDMYKRKATDPNASEQLKACQKCLDGAVTDLTISETEVPLFVTLMCKSDASEELLLPVPGARIKIGDQVYQADKYGGAKARLRPGQKYKVTALARTNTTGDPKQDPYELAYVIQLGYDERIRPDSSGYAEVTLGKKRLPTAYLSLNG